MIVAGNLSFLPLGARQRSGSKPLTEAQRLIIMFMQRFVYSFCFSTIQNVCGAPARLMLCSSALTRERVVGDLDSRLADCAAAFRANFEAIVPENASIFIAPHLSTLLTAERALDRSKAAPFVATALHAANVAAGTASFAAPVATSRRFVELSSFTNGADVRLIVDAMAASLAATRAPLLADELERLLSCGNDSDRDARTAARTHAHVDIAAFDKTRRFHVKLTLSETSSRPSLISQMARVVAISNTACASACRCAGGQRARRGLTHRRRRRRRRRARARAPATVADGQGAMAASAACVVDASRRALGLDLRSFVERRHLALQKAHKLTSESSFATAFDALYVCAVEAPLTSLTLLCKWLGDASSYAAPAVSGKRAWRVRPRRWRWRARACANSRARASPQWSHFSTLRTVCSTLRRCVQRRAHACARARSAIGGIARRRHRAADAPRSRRPRPRARARARSHAQPQGASEEKRHAAEPRDVAKSYDELLKQISRSNGGSHAARARTASRSAAHVARAPTRRAAPRRAAHLQSSSSASRSRRPIGSSFLRGDSGVRVRAAVLISLALDRACARHAAPIRRRATR